MLIELKYGSDGSVYEYDREKVAIERLKMFEPIALSMNPDGYCVADSGGKDSSVIKKLAELSGVKYKINHNHTTLDHPETVYFVRREKARYESIGIKYTVNMPQMSFWKLMQKKGLPPTRLMRYCCEYLKENGGADSMTVTGVRWAESVQRKSRGIAETISKNKAERIVLFNDNAGARKELESCPVKGRKVLNPIIDWADSDVWEFIRKHEIAYNPLYNRGHKRVGCVGCPMSTNAYLEIESMPKYKNMYLRAFKRLMDAREKSGKLNKFISPEQYYLWWTQQITLPKSNDDQIRME